MKGHNWGICKKCGQNHGEHPRGARGNIPWNKGIPLTDEQKENLRGKNIGKKMSEDCKRKNSLSHLGKKHPNTSETLKRLWQTQEFREHMRKFTNKGRQHTTETIEKIRLKNIENIELHRQNTTALWKNKNYQEKMNKARNLKPNQIEKVILSILDRNFPNEWKYVGDLSFWVDGKNPDFINCNGQKKIIELFGSHWHNLNDIPFSRTEKGTKEHYEKFGFDTLIIWDKNSRSRKWREETEKKIIDFHNK